MRGQNAITAAAASLVVSCASGTSSTGSGVGVELYSLPGAIVEQNLGEVVLTFPWELENPKIKRASVGAVKWRLAIEGEDPQTGEVVVGQEAGPGGKTDGVIKVEAVTKTSDEAFDSRIGKPGLRYTMTGTFTIAIAGKEEEYVAEWNGEIFAPKKPDITVRAEAGRFGGKTLEFTFIIGIANPNPFEIQIGAFDYVLFVKDIEISKDSLAQGQRIVPSSELQFDIQRFIGKDDLQELAAELMELDAIAYRLDGKLSVNEIIINVPVAGEIQFAR